MSNQLEDYIRQQLDSGYQVNQIKSHLIKYGYSPNQIDSAINNIHSNNNFFHQHISLISISAVAIVSIIVLAFFAMNLTSSPNTLLDVEVSTTNNQIEPGERLQFTIDLSNMGSDSRYDVIVDYQIISLNNAKRIATKEETIALETRTSKRSSIIIPPEAKDGMYELKAIAKYDDKEAQSSASFNIESKEQPNLSPPPENKDDDNPDQKRTCPKSCDDGDPNTKDYCHPEYKICVNEVIQKDDNNNNKENNEEENEQKSPINDFRKKLQEILEIAPNNPARAEMKCRDLQSQSYIDQCFYKVATKTLESGFCQGIKDNDKRDQCYLEYAVATSDFSVCDRVTDRWVIQSCKSLGHG